VAAACFASVGILLGSLLPTGRAAQAAGVLLWFVEMFLAGAGPPPEVLPGSMVVIGKATPLWHGVRLLQDLWWGRGWNWFEFWIVAGILVGCGVLAWRLFRWE
jgi:ABC-2 type transport system permease protein